MRQYISTIVLATDDSSRLVLHLFSALVHQYRSTRYGRLITACSSFVQCAGTLVPQYLVRTTHHSLFFICLVRQYISTVVLSTDESSRHVLHLFSALLHYYRSTRHGRLITACSSFVQCVSTLVMQYLVRTTHHGLFFICLVRQFISTIVLGTDDLSRFVLHLFSALARQYVSTVVLGKDDSSRLVPHFFSALVRQYCSTWYGRLITACSLFVQCVSTFALQYLVWSTHHGLFFICLVRQYVSSVVLGTDDSSLVLYWFSALVLGTNTLNN